MWLHLPLGYRQLSSVTHLLYPGALPRVCRVPEVGRWGWLTMFCPSQGQAGGGRPVSRTCSRLSHSRRLPRSTGFRSVLRPCLTAEWVPGWMGGLHPLYFLSRERSTGHTFRDRYFGIQPGVTPTLSPCCLAARLPLNISLGALARYKSCQLTLSTFPLS